MVVLAAEWTSPSGYVESGRETEGGVYFSRSKCYTSSRVSLLSHTLYNVPNLSAQLSQLVSPKGFKMTTFTAYFEFLVMTVEGKDSRASPLQLKVSN